MEERNHCESNGESLTDDGEVEIYCKCTRPHKRTQGRPGRYVALHFTDLVEFCTPGRIFVPSEVSDVIEGANDVTKSSEEIGDCQERDDAS